MKLTRILRDLNCRSMLVRTCVLRTIPVLLISMLLTNSTAAAKTASQGSVAIAQASGSESVPEIRPSVSSPRAADVSAQDSTATELALLLLVYCVAIVVASIAGGCHPAALRMSHTTSQVVASLAGGLMLGIAIFHLLPHALHSGLSATWLMQCVMAGIVTMFLLIRCFHFHHHGPLEISTVSEEPCSDVCEHHAPDILSSHDQTHAGPGAPEHESPHCHHAHELSWLGIMAGLSLHSLLDGIALAASVNAESTHPTFLSLFGFGTFLAILLHKPLDSISITSLMVFARWDRRSIIRANLVFAMLCPGGVLLFSAGISQLSGFQDLIVPSALAFSCGIFLCIALSDLLPEMEFHSHNRFLLTAALLAGILIAWGITFLEPVGLH